jgi:ribosomal protein S18 acetylase RimI-like enzyme
VTVRRAGRGAGELAVRAARVTDEAQLVALWSEAEALHARLAPRYFRRAVPPLDEVRVATAGDESGALLVADRGGRVVGFVHIKLYDTPPVPSLAPRRRALVEGIAVAEGVRRRGVGRRLMVEAAAWSRARGAEELLLTVWAENRRAERFYRALGYRPVSRVLGRTL